MYHIGGLINVKTLIAWWMCVKACWGCHSYSARIMVLCVWGPVSNHFAYGAFCYPSHNRLGPKGSAICIYNATRSPPAKTTKHTLTPMSFDISVTILHSTVPDFTSLSPHFSFEHTLTSTLYCTLLDFTPTTEGDPCSFGMQWISQTHSHFIPYINRGLPLVTCTTRHYSIADTGHHKPAKWRSHPHT